MLVYKAVNKVNGKVYIGQTAKTLEERVFEHYKSSKKPKSIFHKALAKYGVLGFDWIILQENINSKAELDILEVQYQYQYKAVEEGYNMVYMGGGGFNQAAVDINKNKKGKTWEDIYTKEGLKMMTTTVLPKFIEVGKPYRFNNISKELQREYASKGGKSHKGKKESEQTKNNISQGLRSSVKFQKMKQDPEYKKERSTDSKANWANPNSVYNTPEYRDKLSKAKIARFEKAFAEVKPKLQELIANSTPKMKICNRLDISYPTLQKYIKLI
jgi:GIY-YIG catalytic domain